VSVTRQVTIWCDGCSKWEQDSKTASSLRKDLKKRGWTQVFHSGLTLDYCPECAKKRPRESSTKG